MSASGKSSNRLYEYNRGYFAGTGNSPASLQGQEDRKAHDKRIAEEEQNRQNTRNEQLWLMRRRSR